MATDNHVTLTGNITRDPELKFLPSGQAAAQFGIAVNRRWQKNGEWQESTSFFNITAYGDFAQNVVDSVTKGARVTVVGRLEQRSWTDQNSGQQRSVVEIVADEISPSLRWATAQVTKNERSGGFGGGNSRPAPAPAPAVPAEDQDFEPFAGGASSAADEPF